VAEFTGIRTFSPWQPTLPSFASTINQPAIESLYGPIKENKGILEHGTVMWATVQSILAVRKRAQGVYQRAPMPP
jgi:hypothetical protein